MSSASVSVGIGSFCDPKDVLGLAHFLEHMLFMGTAKYPEENHYSAFLNEHSGSSNAYTASELTNYYFDVTSEQFHDALDIFAQFFVAPLFTPDGTEREMNAVDSENKRNLQIDARRFIQTLKTYANPEHPFHKFSTGNLRTLKDVPQAKNLDIRQQLLDFYHTHYSANLMKLAIVAREDVDTLQQWVVEMFSAVPNHSFQRPSFNGIPFRSDQMMKVLKVVPVKDLRQLRLRWLIPSQLALFHSKPANYLSHLVGHEGPGSILSFLKSKQWATSLSAGGNDTYQDFSFFTVVIELTESGLENVNEVIGVVYDYLNMLRHEGPKQWVFDELKSITDVHFRFKEKEQPIDYASGLSSLMLDYSSEHTLSGEHLMDEFRPDLITDTLNHLTVDNLLVMIASKTFEGHTTDKEEWYGTEHSVDSMTPELIDTCKRQQTNDKLKLPAPNEFIATDFAIRPQERPHEYPFVLYESPLVRLFFKTDNNFMQPRCNLYIDLHSPIAYHSPRAAVCTKLFCHLFRDAFNEFAYAIEIAGLGYDLREIKQGLHLVLRGFNHKMEILLRSILTALRSFKVDPERYESVKDSVVRSYVNYRNEQSYTHARNYSAAICELKHWSNAQLVEVVSDITAEEVQTHARLLLSELFVEGIVHGNISEAEAVALAKSFESTLQPRPLLAGQLFERRTVDLPVDVTCLYRTPVMDPENINSAVLFHYHIGPATDLTTSVTADMIDQILNEPFFDDLRTKQQLGYIVYSALLKDATAMNSLLFLVQSSNFDTIDVEQRMFKFIQGIPELLEKISDSAWTHLLNGIITKKLEKPKNLREETGRYWHEITKELYRFDKVHEEVVLLRQLTKQHVIDFYRKYLEPNGSERRLLICEVFGKDRQIPAVPSIEEQTEHKLLFIKDPLSFKSMRPLYPIPSNDRLARLGTPTPKL